MLPKGLSRFGQKNFGEKDLCLWGEGSLSLLSRPSSSPSLSSLEEEELELEESKLFKDGLLHEYLDGVAVTAPSSASHGWLF